MRKRGTVILALLFGFACAGFVLLYVQQVEAGAEAQRAEAMDRFGGDQVEVCVATRTISAGETVDEGNAETRLWLVDLLPTDPVTTLSEVEGMPLNATVVAGEVLNWNRFESASKSVSVPSGLQEVGVELSTAQAVGGSLEPGALVDVYVSGSTSTALIASNVLVSAVAEGTSGRLSVTLAVESKSVEEIIAGTQTATLYLTLSAK